MFRVRHNIPLYVQQLRRVHDLWERDQRNILEVLGTQLLSLAQQAYVQKARGNQGSDGITWAPLKRGTLEARVRRRSPSRRIVSQRKRIANQISKTKGKGSGRKIEQLRKKRKALNEKHKGLVDREVSRHEIGVDTGLQRSSASPGFAGSDGRGGNLFRIEQARVTVGYNRTYSRHFDAKRPLLPDPLPKTWEQQMEKQVSMWASRLMDSQFGSSAAGGGA